MKRMTAWMGVLAAALFLVSPVIAEEPAVRAATLVVDGMALGSAAQVESSLKALPGVSQVKVSEEKGLAVVVYDPAQVQQEEFTRAMQAAGFLATFAKANFRCPTCPATYAEGGTCIVDGSTLEAVS